MLDVDTDRNRYEYGSVATTKRPHKIPGQRAANFESLMTSSDGSNKYELGARASPPTRVCSERPPLLRGSLRSLGPPNVITKIHDHKHAVACEKLNTS